MNEKDKSLVDLINSSGFLLQLKIEDEIKKIGKNYPWQILCREHPWKDKTTNNDGFIDLMLSNHHCRIIIECKRVQDSTWIFLSPDDASNLRSHARFIQSNLPQHNAARMGLSNVNLSPSSIESSFCITRGTDKNDRPLLERRCGELVISTKCIANQEIGLDIRPIIYVPMIVTTATLRSCQFNAKDIDISIGMIDTKSCKISEVPYVRFRKCLSTDIEAPRVSKNLTDLNEAGELTILIVNSNSFIELLSKIEIDNFTRMF